MVHWRTTSAFLGTMEFYRGGACQGAPTRGAVQAGPILVGSLQLAMRLC
jgi:hypothetical protein